MTPEDADRCLRVLTAAYPTYPMSDDTIELYHQVFAKECPDVAVAFAVVADWTISRVTFPKPAELVEEYRDEAMRRMRRAKALQQAQQHGEPGTVACRTCEDDRMVSYTDEAGVIFAHPCPDCDPDRYRYWQGGHMAKDHDPALCDDPICVKRAKSRGRSKR